MVAVVRGTEGSVVERGVGDGFADVLDGTLDWLHDHLNRRDVDTLLANVLHFGGELGPGLKHSGLADDQLVALKSENIPVQKRRTTARTRAGDEHQDP
jgi:hypothetical protein